LVSHYIRPAQPLPMKTLLPLFIAEFIGTALLLIGGLSIVILNWGDGSDIAQWIPSVEARRAVTGFLFGTMACLVALSPVGRISGAHINPAVSVAFWLRGKMKTHAMIGYILAQMAGAAIGCLPLLLWGDLGKSVRYGVTLPGSAGPTAAFAGEFIATVMLIVVLFIFVGNKDLRKYTPFTLPFLYGFMVWAESAYSGCSTNPARSFGPAFISKFFTHYWIYIVAPIAAAASVVGLFRLSQLHELLHIKSARTCYHEVKSHKSICTS
jgi:aquaporin Z